MLVSLAVSLAAALAWTSGTAAHGWWWLTNTEPPLITSALPTDPISAAIQTSPVIHPVDRAVLVHATVDGQPLALPDLHQPLIIDTARLADGPHLLRLEAQDTSRLRNRGGLELRFTSDNTPPSVGIEGAPERLRAGHVAALRLTPSEPADLRAQWLDAALPLHDISAGARLALIAAPVTSTGGRAVVTLRARDAAGNTAAPELELSIDPAPVPRQTLTVPALLAPLATGPVALDEAAQLYALTSAIRPERLWVGESRAPLNGPRTTGFGDRRDYPDGHVASHSGFDVAVPVNTPVQAVATGIVTHVGAFPQRGTTVILDHGWGIFTLYAHLAESSAAPVQLVTQGEVVGLAGSTGLSTGPHLHWEVRLRGLPVDPDSWIALTRTLP